MADSEPLGPDPITTMLEALRAFPWRRNHNRKNAGPGYSHSFGRMVIPFKGWGDTKDTQKYPEMVRLLTAFGHWADPAFEFSCITINKNYQCKPHFDKNKGVSMIIGLGDYTGGELNVNGTKYDIHNQRLYFDGSRAQHWVEPFEGERYTIVFYRKTE